MGRPTLSWGGGSDAFVGPIVTAGGLAFIGAALDQKIRAFHVRTGEQLWEATLSAGRYATPANHGVDGRQHVVTAGR